MWELKARIFLRYFVGGVGFTALGNSLANDPDVVSILAMLGAAVFGILVEFWYRVAKKHGRET